MKKMFSMVLAVIFVMTFMVGSMGTVGYAAEKVTLNLWVNSGETKFDKELNKQFAAAYPNIVLKQTIHEEDPGNTFFQNVAKGTAPDTCIFSATVMDKNVKAGIIVPLDKYFASWSENKFYVKKWIDGFTFKGKLYGLPTYGSTMLFGYNKALFKAAGISGPPKTWDETLAFAKKLTVPAKQQYGYGMLTQWTEWFFQFHVWQAGGDLTIKKPDGQLALTFTSPAVMKAAQFYQTLKKEKVTQPDMTLGFEKLVTAFASGKVAMMPFATDWVSWVMSMGMKFEDIGLAPFPKGPANKGTTFGGVGCWGINAKSSKAVQDAAWTYITFLNTKKNALDKLKWLKANQGATNPILLPRTDYSLKDIGIVDPLMEKTLRDVANDTKGEEFYGKGEVGKYVDQAVQKIITDPKADPKVEFKKQQDLATKEALSAFNKAVLKK